MFRNFSIFGNIVISMSTVCTFSFMNLCEVVEWMFGKQISPLMLTRRWTFMIPPLMR